MNKEDQGRINQSRHCVEENEVKANIFVLAAGKHATSPLQAEAMALQVAAERISKFKVLHWKQSQENDNYTVERYKQLALKIN